MNDGKHRRPAEVYISNFAMIRALAVDVAVVDVAAVNSIKNKKIEKRHTNNVCSGFICTSACTSGSPRTE
jgi:hypothetical protein